MNLRQLKKNIGSRVQLTPPPIHLDAFGRELPPQNEDWILSDVTDVEILIDAAKIGGLRTRLGPDVVHHFDTNKARSAAGGLQYGFLILKQQMYIQEFVITWQPCPTPGTRVAPVPVTVVDLLVESRFPEDTGMCKRLAAAGYTLHWVGQERVPGIEVAGGERVIEYHRGKLTSFHCGAGKGLLVLVKKKQP